MKRKIRFVELFLWALFFGSHSTANASSWPGAFMWGISSSSYQTEDVADLDPLSFFKADWDLFFDLGKLIEPKGNATWSYSLYERDIAALKSLGVTHYRFSIEWARVEPMPGVFNEAAIDRYVTIARRLKEEGITPIVCLWHFTYPGWTTDFKSKKRNGWFHPLAKARWPHYVRKMVSRLSSVVDVYAPQNEPNAHSMMAFLGGMGPPGAFLDVGLYEKHIDEAAVRFLEAAAIIREVQPGAKIISVQSLIHWVPAGWDVFKFWYGKAQEYNFSHLDRIAEVVDLIGFNYYFRETASPFSFGAQEKRTGDHVSDMGWIIDPDGLGVLIRQLAERYGKPMAITENGMADARDVKKQKYVRDHVEVVRRAVADGFDVRGYFHWSLIDNFEWAKGYGPKFGLYSFDRDTKRITPKPSALVYKELIQRGL